MKIWFDISNSPHINMFEFLMKDLVKEGHEVVVTSRPLANTIDLLNQKNISHTTIGKHYGKNFIKKSIGFPIRIIGLYNFLKNKKIDLAVSQSSFHSPIVAKLLQIPSIYTNDNEHAMGNKTSFFFASKILIPENFTIKKNLFFNYTYKTKYYPGLKEGIYLWLKNNLKAENNENKEFTIFIRPEPQTAQYYKGKINFLDELITDLQSNFKIIVLCRNNLQLLHYQQEKFSRITVPNEPIDFDEIIKDCNLFIGAGGSMTREAAILGIPTISVYQDTLLKVDEYLIENKMMLHEPYLTSNKVVNAIEQLRINPPSIELINKGKKAYELLKSEILQYNTI